MQKLVSVFVTLFLLDYGRSQELFFSVTNLDDSYIYPYWKSKDDLQGTFYEDAVVVRSKAIALGDGVSGSKGYSGFFAHYHCLKITMLLQNMIPLVSSNDELKKIVEAEIKKTIKSYLSLKIW